MRHLHKAWSNRPKPGQKGALVDGRTWTRRVRWYQGVRDVRLEFHDEGEWLDVIYPDAERAQEAFDAFVEGRLVVEDGILLDAALMD